MEKVKEEKEEKEEESSGYMGEYRRSSVSSIRVQYLHRYKSS